MPAPVSGDLNDAYQRVSAIIYKWCEDMTSAGKISLCVESSAGTAYRRFTTDAMDGFVPEQYGVKRGWSNGHFFLRNPKHKEVRVFQNATRTEQH